MAKHSQDRLPVYLESYEAFRLGEDIATRLERAGKNPDIELERLLTSKIDLMQIVLLCELISDSRGRPCWAGCWNIYLKGFLFKSKYVAASSVARVALGALQNLPNSRPLRAKAGWLEAIHQLKQRLMMPPVRVSRPDPLLSKSAYKKIEIGFNDPGQSFGLTLNLICGNDPKFAWALDATALQESAVEKVMLCFNTEPNNESVDAIRILLHRFRNRITHLRCDAWIGPKGGRVTKMSIAFWNLLKKEVVQLKKLWCFESGKFAIDEATAIEFVSIQSLRLFYVYKHGFYQKIDSANKFGERFVSAIIKRGRIIVDIPDLSRQLQMKLFNARPRFQLAINSRYVTKKTLLYGHPADALVVDDDDDDNEPAEPSKSDDDANVKLTNAESGLNDPFYPFEVTCTKEDDGEVATVGFGVFSKYDWALELESLDDYYLNGYGIAGLLQAIIHDNKLRENVDSIDAEGSDVLITLNSWKAAKRLGKLASKAFVEEKKLRQLIARARELGFED